MPELVQNWSDFLLWMSAITGAASYLYQALKLITGITPSKKDDAFVDGFGEMVGNLQALLSRIAFNPKDADDARR